MADIALIFHWPPSEMIGMDIVDLIEWRRRAVDRWNRINETKAQR